MKRFFSSLLILGIGLGMQAQTTFTKIIDIPVTPVKNQNKSGTCWSYSATSFLEAELLRLGKGTFDLSEMYFVYQAYLSKADNYVRLRGVANFSEGGQAHDVLDVLRTHGAIPESEYSGLAFGDSIHNHSKLSSYLSAVLKEIVKQDKPDDHRNELFRAILDVYLGRIPNTFSYQGKEYTTEQFSTKVLTLNPDDYIEITSVMHHPFYQAIRLEIPDNWTSSMYYNVPIKELIETIHYSLEKGYTVCWDGDVSEKNFNHKKSYAEIEKGEIVNERNRQKQFDQFQTTDDHLMHLIGTAKDENGKQYFTIKNSWGTHTNESGGLLYMSEDYAYMKTIAIMVHKNAIPTSLKQKLKL